MNCRQLKPALIIPLLLLVACSSPPRHINLMPTPDVYDVDKITPFAEQPNFSQSPYLGMLYATDRAHGESILSNAQDEYFYNNERGHLLRLGIAGIELGEEGFTWDQARQISLAKNRTQEYPLKVSAINELGIFDGSFNPFTDDEQLAQKSTAPRKHFANLINQKLAISKYKDINIYIHGYKVVFDNSILVSTELWHYLGYEGVFIAYSWPATPERTAYFADAETTISSAFALRKFIEYLSNETSAEHINIIAYSQGTRLAAEVIRNLALKYHYKTRDEAFKKLRIGNVVLIGSDIDRHVMASYISDGLLKIPHSLTLYVSEEDRALGLSRFFYRRNRLGQIDAGEAILPATRKFLNDSPEFSVINVTNAEGATDENGHRYFRKSPWASSDLLMSLRYHLSPSERGLVHSEGSPIWSFPEDYISRLRRAILQANPELSENKD